MREALVSNAKTPDKITKGIGKRLFLYMLKDNQPEKLTVNSSPYAVPVYHKLGFCDVDEEQIVNGIRFTPMELKTAGGK